MRFGYARSEDGIVHLISAIDSEFTLCGDAFDGGAGVGLPEQAPWDNCKHGPVTCPRCITQINNCRGARVRREQEGGKG